MMPLATNFIVSLPLQEFSFFFLSNDYAQERLGNIQGGVLFSVNCFSPARKGTVFNVDHMNISPFNYFFKYFSGPEVPSKALAFILTIKGQIKSNRQIISWNVFQRRESRREQVNLLRKIGRKKFKEALIVHAEKENFLHPIIFLLLRFEKLRVLSQRFIS